MARMEEMVGGIVSSLESVSSSCLYLTSVATIFYSVLFISDQILASCHKNGGSCEDKGGNNDWVVVGDKSDRNKNEKSGADKQKIDSGKNGRSGQKSAKRVGLERLKSRNNAPCVAGIPACDGNSRSVKGDSYNAFDRYLQFTEQKRHVKKGKWSMERGDGTLGRHGNCSSNEAYSESFSSVHLEHPPFRTPQISGAYNRIKHKNEFKSCSSFIETIV